MTNAIDTLTASFLNDPTRFFFFTGKGGVGKTSLSCASALALAVEDKKVLIRETRAMTRQTGLTDIQINEKA